VELGPRDNNLRGWLITKTEYRNDRLQFDVKFSRGSNSGLGLRSFLLIGRRPKLNCTTRRILETALPMIESLAQFSLSPAAALETARTVEPCRS
jgi:hypothetical protein